jgi:hypothetical protein
MAFGSTLPSINYRQCAAQMARHPIADLSFILTKVEYSKGFRDITPFGTVHVRFVVCRRVPSARLCKALNDTR